MTTINFSPSFDTTPVLILLPTTAGVQPADVQISSISASTAVMYAIEPREQDGPHLSMQSSSLAIEPGNYQLSSTGPRVEAGTVTTNKTVSGDTTATQSWETVTFSEPFDAPPAVVATKQTNHNEGGENNLMPPRVSSIPWITTVIRNITTSGFEVSLERSEAYVDGGTVSLAETIGYVAMETSHGNFLDASSNTVTWASMNTNTSGGFDERNTATQIFYPQESGSSIFSTTPIVVASKTSRNDNDGGWLRLHQHTNTRLRLPIDEDTEVNNERSHTTQESVSIIAFSQSFVIPELINTPPQFFLQKTVAVLEDPVNGVSSTHAKAIPGSILEYALTLTNRSFGPLSNDPNTIVLNDEIPAGTELVVTPSFSPSGVPCGSATTHLFQGSPSSGLSCTASTVTYSNNGISFSSTPSAATKHIRIAPQGTFNLATDGAVPPSATFKFHVKKL